MSNDQRRGADRAALTKANFETLRKMLAQMSKQLEAALPRFITAERMIRVATTTVQRVPKLLETDPITVIGSIMQAAQLGLEPDNVTGTAYLVPFWNSKNNRLECNLIPGYRGLMLLARRSREISAFDARVVKAGDLFEYEYGSRQYLRHKPPTPAIDMKRIENGVFTMAPDPPTVAAYMIAFFSGKGGPSDSQFHVMTRDQLERAKQFTKSRNKAGEITGPWIEHPDAMFQKTTIRRGAKLLPFSIELQTAIALDEKASVGKSQNLGLLGAEALGLDYTPTAEDDDDAGDEGNGANGQDATAEQVKEIDALFVKLGFAEAKATAKLQEYKGRYPDLIEWLKSEAAKPAGNVSTTKAADAKAPADVAPKADEIFGGGQAAATDKPATETAAATETAPSGDAAAGKTNTPTSRASRKKARFSI